MDITASLRTLIDIQLMASAYWMRQARLAGKRHAAIDQYIIDGLISATPGMNHVADRLLTVVQMGEAVRQAVVEMSGDSGQNVPGIARFVLTEEILNQVMQGSNVNLFLNDDDAIRKEKLNLLRLLRELAVLAGQSAALEQFDTAALDYAVDGLTRLGGLPIDLSVLPEIALAQAKIHLGSARSHRFGPAETIDLSPAVPVSANLIVVAGSDFQILEDVLLQSYRRDVAVYTQGALRTAHCHPGFRQFDHLAGHVDIVPGRARLVLTTGFSEDLLRSHPASGIFTTGLLGFDEAVHITDKAYSALF